MCGKNVLLANNKQSARRAEKSFCDAIVFSNRPIGVYERIYVKIVKLSSLWNGMIRFGFTNVDPDTHRRNFHKQTSNLNFLTDDESNEDDSMFDLPKYVYPNLTNKRGYWAGAMAENSLKENDVLYFYVNSNGEIHYGINNNYKGQFLDGIDVYTKPQQAQSLWALFDIYGNTISIEIINKKFDLNNNNNNETQRPNESNYLTLDTVSSIPNELNNFRTLQTLSNNSSISTASLTNSSISNRSIGSVQSSLSSTTGSITSNNMTTIIPNRMALQQPGQHVVMRLNRNEVGQRQNLKNTHEKFDKMLISCRRLCVDNHLNETLRNSIIDHNQQQHFQSPTLSRASGAASNRKDPRRSNELNDKIKQFYESIPVLLHEQSSSPLTKSPETGLNKFLNNIHGRNVKICLPESCVAYRESSIFQLNERHNHSDNLKKSATRNGYIFLDKPVEKGRSFCLQIVGIDQSVNESKMSLGIGCTTCNPSQLVPDIDLPDDADDLLDRPEYWVVFKNLFNTDIVIKKHQVSLADELCFRLDEANGNLNFFINGSLITNCLFNVDLTQKLWFFFDLCGKTSAIRLIKPCQLNNSTLNSNLSVNQAENNVCQRRRPNSALIDYYKSQLLPMSGESKEADVNMQTHGQKAKKEDKSANSEECRICLDAPIECVFYSCGHMCLCWNW